MAKGSNNFYHFPEMKQQECRELKAFCKGIEFRGQFRYDTNSLFRCFQDREIYERTGIIRKNILNQDMAQISLINAMMNYYMPQITQITQIITNTQGLFFCYENT